MLLRFLPLALWAAASAAQPAPAPTYAERLGWDKGDRVLILHMDDAGMSYESNAGIQNSIEGGAARSFSVMMPCPWVPQIVRYIKAHPEVDAGLHLTLTSEWKDYRWGPLAGAGVVPGLVDLEGALSRSVADVAARATPTEVFEEIAAQLERAERMGFHPTHLDSHMGTLFAKPAFLEKYVQLGIENRVPVMLPGGHASHLLEEDASNGAMIGGLRKLGEQLWRAGLPVLDDLHSESYDWKPPEHLDVNDNDAVRRWRTGRYIETLSKLKPGLTMVILHPTQPSDGFGRISDSGLLRRADMLTLTDPVFMRFLRDEGFILTTWRELIQRRRDVRGGSFPGTRR